MVGLDWMLIESSNSSSLRVEFRTSRVTIAKTVKLAFRILNDENRIDFS